MLISAMALIDSSEALILATSERCNSFIARPIPKKMAFVRHYTLVGSGAALKGVPPMRF
jgi:hypothetical protein